MRLFKVDHIRRDSGHCFIGKIKELTSPGESLGSKRKSPLILFEDGRQIGPQSTVHNLIRLYGKGAYSHWGDQLYFSASDNSDPSYNGRNYMVVCPTSLEEEEVIKRHVLLEASYNPELFAGVLQAGLSTNGSELHSVFSFQILRYCCERASREIESSVILEIGASPTSGLAICLGLAGAQHVILNNITKINDNINLDFARNVALLSAMSMQHKRKLEEVVEISRDGESCRLRPDIFTITDCLSASEIDKKLQEFSNSIDLIFSFSVFEHIENLNDVLGSVTKLAKNGAIAINGIDTRDHTDFNQPLKYLYFDDDAFKSIYSSDNNRRRFNDYIKIMEESSWLVKENLFIKPLKVLSSHSTDMYHAAESGAAGFFCSFR